MQSGVGSKTRMYRVGHKKSYIGLITSWDKVNNLKLFDIFCIPSRDYGLKSVGHGVGQSS